MGLTTERVIHSIKTALACLIGFAIIKLLREHLLFDQWLIITILVVMCAQISVGSVYVKSTLRFIGTCVGSLLAAFAILTFDNNPLAFALVIAFSGMIFSFLATSQKSYSDAATLGAVTTAIILINPAPTLTLTIARFAEISIGIAIAALVSQFVLPIHARKHLRAAQARTLILLSDYYSLAINAGDNATIANLDEEILKSFITQRKLAQEAKQELIGSRFEPQHFKLIIDSERKILRGIDFLNTIYSKFDKQQLLNTQSQWLNFNKKIVFTLKQLAAFVENPKHEQRLVLDIPTIYNVKTEIMATHNSEELEHLHALFICLDNITHHLHNLSREV